MKKFLITGGAGFIGSYLAKALVEKNYSVTILDDLNTGKISNIEQIKDKINFIKGDIRDLDTLRKICVDKDGIFHLAARASVQESFEKPEEYFDVNVKGTENIFKVAQENKIKVVYSSSSSIYGNPANLPIKEDDPKNPINPYAETKLGKEKLAIKFASQGLKVIGLRYLNVFGEGQSKEYAGVITLFLDRIKEKQAPKINGDGLQSRDFVYVEDVVSANILSMESKINHTFFNVGTGTTMSILDIAKLIIKFSGLKLEPIFCPPLKGDVRITISDISHIKKELNWKPTVFLEEWLKKKVSTFNIK